MRVLNHMALGRRSSLSRPATVGCSIVSNVSTTRPNSDPCSVPNTRQPCGANQSTGVPYTALLTEWSSMP